MKNIALTAIVFTCILFVSCNKSSTNAVTTVTIDTALKTDFNFQKGSYWIYRDSITGNTDSFFVQYNTHTFDNVNNEVIIEGINITVLGHDFSEPNEDTTNLYFGCASNMLLMDFLMTHLGASTLAIKEISLCPLINYPYQNSFTQFNGFPGYSTNGDKANLINIFNSYSLNGQAFPNVAEVEHSSNDSQYSYNQMKIIAYNYDDKFYVCPNVGLIKIILNHPQDSLYRVWELQRYNIVK